MFTKLRSPFKFVATSRPLDLFHLNRFDSYYKFTREKMIDIMLCRERSEISLTVLLVNCHDVTTRIFDRWISRQTGMKSPLKWQNQPGGEIRTLESLLQWRSKELGRAGKPLPYFKSYRTLLLETIFWSVWALPLISHFSHNFCAPKDSFEFIWSLLFFVRHLMKLVLQPLFHIARTYVKGF